MFNEDEKYKEIAQQVLELNPSLGPFLQFKMKMLVIQIMKMIEVDKIPKEEIPRRVIIVRVCQYSGKMNPDEDITVVESRKEMFKYILDAPVDAFHFAVIPNQIGILHTHQEFKDEIVRMEKHFEKLEKADPTTQRLLGNMSFDLNKN